MWSHPRLLSLNGKVEVLASLDNMPFMDALGDGPSCCLKMIGNEEPVGFNAQDILP